MTAVTVTNPTGPDQPPPAVPPHPDQRAWGYEMVTDSARVYADTLADLVHVLSPGYLDADDTGQWVRRYLVAALAQVQVQARLNTDPAFLRLDPTARALLTGPRNEPVVVPTWDHPIPLVLLRTDYEPARPLPAPQPVAGLPANVWWIDPSDDWSLLVTLTATGWVTVHQAIPAGGG